MSRRTELMVAEDRAKISNLLARGYRNKAEIARLLNEGRDEEYHIGPAQVSKDISAMEKAYLERGFEDIEIYRHRAMDELAYLMRVYYEAYEKSCVNKITLETQQNMDDESEYDEIMEHAQLNHGSMDNVHPFGRTGKVKDEYRGEGNPAFLNGIKACLDSLNKIRTVDGATKLAITDATGTQEYVGVAEMMKARMDELSKREAPSDTDALLLAPPPSEEVEEDYIEADED